VGGGLARRSPGPRPQGYGQPPGLRFVHRDELAVAERPGDRGPTGHPGQGTGKL